MNKKLKWFLIIVGIAIIIGIIIYFSIQNARPSLIINSSPVEVDVTIDGKTIKNYKAGTKIRINNGSHKVVVNRDGFEPSDFEINMNKEDITKYLELVAVSSEAKSLMLNYENSIASEGVAANDYAQYIDKNNADNPELSVLPINEKYLYIYPCSPDDNNNTGLDIAICIDFYYPTEKDRAPSVLQENGINPNKYELIYVDKTAG